MVPSVQQWQAQGEYWHWQGHRLFYRHHSRPGKPTLLLIHGFPSASWDWWALWPALSERFTLVAPDLLGFGLSDKPHPHAYRIGEQTQLLLELMTHLQIESAALLAHDYGDTVAQELLARQLEGHSPVHWTEVTLLNGGLFPEAHQPLPVQRLMAGPLGPLLSKLLGQNRFEKSLKRIWGETPPAEAELEVLWQLLNQCSGRQVLPALLHYMAERKAHRDRWVGALQRTEVPVTLIDGLADPISGASLVQRFAELCPQHRLVTLPGVGHYPQLEAPQRVLDALLAEFGSESG
ncbi:alpha/beta fold hydrolase [Ferrimonas balearica]|uniref:alpha/beta fold hydrolase n=1 Tax=Ferrimonas balearica TaxID=44012 RepID=UPI001C99F467|nr:alpha/beta hydrolase [Ferrimonas balearica]MBY5993996.1 alpha/beta hydrolase [Ferrimonas balearica]